MPERKIVTRFAPSPTGFLHVGSIRTALYAWIWAKKNNGTFILRIEDTDKEREVAGAIPHILQSLQWLGVTWDEGPDVGGKHSPYIQSERLHIYKKYAEKLIESGYAYPDPYTNDEVELFRNKAREEKRPFLYRNHRPEKFEKWDGTKPLRFKVPVIKSYTWNDVVRGELSAGEDALDDFILIKSDGYPTYNFAHIVDDVEMGVTHIMRADEFIASTPKFLSLYDALNITPPQFVTLPPILGSEGLKKLSKRDGAKDILDYKNEGYIPEALVNFLVLIGWNPGGEKEILSISEIVELFDISKIHKSGGMFNEEKLLWMNKEYIKLQSESLQYESVKKYMSEYSDDVLKRLFPSILDRISFYGELLTIKDTEFKFLIEKPMYPKEKLIWKDSNEKETASLLSGISTLLTSASFDSPQLIKSIVMPYAEEHGKGKVLWPLRFCLSGQEKSIDPFTICFVLNKDETLSRINMAIKVLNS